MLTTGWFLENAWLIPLIPGIGFAVILLVGKRLPMQGSEVGIATMAASLVIATGTAYQWIQRVDSAHEGEGAVGAVAGFARTVFPTAQEAGHSEPFIEPVIRKWVWWQNGGFEFGLGQHIDGLAVVLLFLVAFISLLVQIYSTEYVKGDRRYTHFFAAITLFSAGMLVMVLAENMVQLILGWEIMGLCSFLLIGHWWEDEGNSRAAVKAFLTVRVGDVGLLVGTAILFFGANEWATERGSNGFSIHAISGWALSGDGSDTVLLWAAIALFIACIGKSGQFPLHTWLPDAMAGPTPVSSLLHSSTMVVAGVFLVARLYPVFFEGLGILDSGVNLIAVIGGITIVIAAALAFVQNDIKRVLAYSTVSQLGYMMMGLGVGAWTPAVFHLFTHAFFKCCLFLCAGSVSHSGSHHSFDMKKDMGGLFKKMPITAWTWILATAALCGVPFFSGFFSKDEIIDNADHNGYPVFFVVGLIGAAMTAAYMTRATYLTFFGKPRGAAAGEHHGDEHGEEHEMAHVDEHEVALPAQHWIGASRRSRVVRSTRVAVADHGAARHPRDLCRVRRVPQRAGDAVQDREVRRVGRAARGRGAGCRGGGDARGRIRRHGGGRNGTGRERRGRGRGDPCRGGRRGGGGARRIRVRVRRARRRRVLRALAVARRVQVVEGDAVDPARRVRWPRQPVDLHRHLQPRPVRARRASRRASPRPAGVTTSSSTSTTSITSTRR